VLLWIRYKNEEMLLGGQVSFVLYENFIPILLQATITLFSIKHTKYTDPLVGLWVSACLTADYVVAWFFFRHFHVLNVD